MKLLGACLAIIHTLFLATSIGRADDNQIVYQTTQISEHAYIVTRNWDEAGKSRTNVGVIVGEQGLTLINPLYGRETDQLDLVLKQISDKPVEYVINSNWDFHNTDANAYFRAQGATIIGHENLKYFENTMTQLTFEDQLELDLGTETIRAYRSYGHSMGHINVYLEKANAIFMSDSYRDQWMTTPGPFGYQGHIKGLRSALALSNAETKIVPGNTTSTVFGSPMDVEKEIALRETFVARVVALEKQGKSVSDISNDSIVRDLFKDNYERYPDYGRDLSAPVRAALYGARLKKGRQSDDHLSTYAANYMLPDGEQVEVFLEDGHLFARSLGLFYYLLAPVSEDRFQISWYRHRYIEFSRDEQGRIAGFRIVLAAADTRYGQEQILSTLRDIELIKRVD